MGGLNPGRGGRGWERGEREALAAPQHVPMHVALPMRAAGGLDG